MDKNWSKKKKRNKQLGVTFFFPLCWAQAKIMMSSLCVLWSWPMFPDVWNAPAIRTLWTRALCQRISAHCMAITHCASPSVAKWNEKNIVQNSYKLRVIRILRSCRCFDRGKFARRQFLCCLLLSCVRRTGCTAARASLTNKTVCVWVLNKFQFPPFLGLRTSPPFNTHYKNARRYTFNYDKTDDHYSPNLVIRC